VFINNAIIPESASVRYQGIQLYKKLNWKEHIVTKRKYIDVIKKIRLVIMKKITANPGKYNPSIQSSDKTHMDLWD
jgi:hypothetical protein